MASRGTPERRKTRSAVERRDLTAAPADSGAEYKLFLDVDGALACVLWQRARDVRLWARFRPDVPHGLFRDLSGVYLDLQIQAFADAPEIRRPLTVLRRLVRYPNGADSGAIAKACIAISDWADERNRCELALIFAEAAAAAQPESAEAAAIAGLRCLRTTCEPGAPPVEQRALQWLRRSVRLAARNGDTEWYIRAHIRYGLLLYRQGRYARARRIYKRAAWKADWAGRDELAAKAHHDLVAIESHVGTYTAAEYHTLKALELYSLRHERIQYLIHDYAFALMRHSYYSPSLQLLDAVWEFVPPDNRLNINSTIARVAAGLHLRERFENHASQVVLLAEICADGATWAFGHLAIGAVCFEEWDRAEAYAGRALELAISRQETDAIRNAYAVLDQIIAREKAPRPSSTPESVRRSVALCLDRLARLREPADEAVPSSQVITTAWAP